MSLPKAIFCAALIFLVPGFLFFVLPAWLASMGLLALASKVCMGVSVVCMFSCVVMVLRWEW